MQPLRRYNINLDSFVFSKKKSVKMVTAMLYTEMSVSLARICCKLMWIHVTFP